ncbi:MAG: DUF3460 family protein [Neisseriaceae bacterium]|nr:MAG: DUF3460 family protein [Neisseriaceae bacterium]
MYHYTSDTTHFMQDFLQNNPKEQDQRLKHRNKLWDVTLNFDELIQFELGEIPKKPYTYFPNIEQE